MTHYVAKVLHLSPASILDTWSVPQLLVTYGQYANEESYKNYKEWESLDIKQRGKIKKPEKYAVKFLGFDELE